MKGRSSGPGIPVFRETVLGMLQGIHSEVEAGLGYKAKLCLKLAKQQNPKQGGYPAQLRDCCRSVLKVLSLIPSTA